MRSSERSKRYSAPNATPRQSFAVGSLTGNDVQPGTPGPSPALDPTSTATPIPQFGRLEPGTYVISTLDADFDAAHRITIDVPDGYEGFEGFAIIKEGEIQGFNHLDQADTGYIVDGMTEVLEELPGLLQPVPRRVVRLRRDRAAPSRAVPSSR